MTGRDWTRRLRWWLIDLAAIGIFVVIGRSTHADGLTPQGIVWTAWPFVAGSLMGAAATVIGPGAVRRYPGRPAGVVVWLATVLIGLVLRKATGQGTAVSFVVVTAIVLGVLLLGWRAVKLIVDRRRAPAVTAAAVSPPARW